MLKVIANLLGYSLIKKVKSPSLRTHLPLVIREQKIDLVIDVGANKGQFGRLLRKIGYKGDILSFEPVGSTFEILKRRSSADGRWEAARLALGDHKGTMSINTFEEASNLSSILSPNSFGTDLMPAMQTTKKETINVDTLDSVLKERRLSGRRIMLKMDTQGYDLNVFRGAKESINDIHAMVSEISFRPIYENMPSYHEALMEYERAGFLVTGLYPVSRDEDLTIIEMDCVLTKPSHQ